MNNINFKDFNLNPNLLKALEELGYSNPTDVQKEVLPIVLQKKDLIVKAQTGSGKTASFAIPLCQSIEVEIKNPKALVLTPTRELAVQVKEDINNIGRYNKIRSVAIFGKQPITSQINELKQRVHVVVGTPGRTLDHIKRETLNVSEIDYLVLDEADEMLSMGFLEEVEEILSYLPKKRTTLLFSATIPEQIKTICDRHMKSPKNVEITPNKLTVENIKQGYFEVKDEDKFSLLEKLLIKENPDSAILFCRTKENVDTLISKLEGKRYPSKGLHGGMLQPERLRTIDEFKSGKFRFLIATDIASRGLDIDKVSLVVNYDLPMEKEKYVHRIGRTGRAGNSGVALTFKTPYEDRFFQEIQDYINYKVPKLSPPSREEFLANKEDFKLKNENFKKVTTSKKKEVSKDITKIYLNGGKKKKIRPGDIVGAICRIPGVEPDDIGIIDVSDNVSYVDIMNGKGDLVLRELKNATIKGKSLKVEKAKN